MRFDSALSTNLNSIVMKNLILGAAALLAFASCEKQQPQPAFNTTDGFYSVTLMSVSESGWGGGVDTDTTFEDLCYLATDYGTIYTINRDSAVSPIPLLGINYEQTFEFPVSLNDTAVQIGYETWYLARVSNGDLHITRYTDYFGMGQDIQTLILTEL